jgi:hypothetical protein
MRQYYALELYSNGRRVKWWDFYTTLTSARKDAKDCKDDGYDVVIYRETKDVCNRWLEVERHRADWL